MNHRGTVNTEEIYKILIILFNFELTTRNPEPGTKFSV